MRLLVNLLMVVSLFFTLALPVASEEEILDYPGKDKFALRVAVGYAGSFLNLDYKKDVAFIEGEEAIVLSENVDNGFADRSIAASIGIKHSLPVTDNIYFEYFSIGFSLDYNLLPINNVSLKAESLSYSGTYKGDPAIVHTVSFITYLEGRYPIKTSGGSWIAPYLRFGIGPNFNFSDNTDKFEVTKVTFAVIGAFGVEFFLGSENTSFFLEIKGHYNDQADFVLRPTGSRFQGEVNMSTVQMLLGVNLYL